MNHWSICYTNIYTHKHKVSLFNAIKMLWMSNHSSLMMALVLLLTFAALPQCLSELIIKMPLIEQEIISRGERKRRKLLRMKLKEAPHSPRSHFLSTIEIQRESKITKRDLLLLLSTTPSRWKIRGLPNRPSAFCCFHLRLFVFVCGVRRWREQWINKAHNSIRITTPISVLEMERFLIKWNERGQIALLRWFYCY